MNKKIRAGIIDLSEIFEFVKRNSVIPCGRLEFKLYSKLCDELTKNIPETSGWYFWMKYRDRKIDQPIYIGKAGKTKKKNSLRYRINYELKTERICFWADVAEGGKAFADQHKFYGGRFDKSAKRAQRKVGAKFIIWISDPNIKPVEIDEVERILIDQYKPQVNMQRAKRNRAFEKAKEAADLFRSILTPH
jgi:hypothetical protein